MMWTVDAPMRLRIGRDAAILLGDMLAIGEWPAALEIVPAHDSVEAWAAASVHARAELAGADVVVDGAVREDIASAIVTACTPEVVLGVRAVDAVGIRRTMLCRNGFAHVLLVHDSAGVTIETLGTPDIDGVATILADRMPDASPIALEGSFSAPTDELCAAIGGHHDAVEVADALVRLGAASSAAATIADVLVGCTRHLEIVATARVDGRPQQTAGSVAVYDSPRGRLVAAPSVAPDQRAWTTLSAGSGHRVRQAIGLLIETLPSRRWMP
ncbi:ESX secretion-associated protein EspG [Williamsia sp.]|uniref:ESX secretion-associated protein EspG n=1 Tax=Williamsia sp. TaxID=1872085 RepID=UPI001A20E9E9|nr:ESX secretion-associated protein EspG [Williamsia sp.]MBJ7291452.1 ESX secretion-associated protein EspG [Williamsia sp.]